MYMAQKHTESITQLIYQTLHARGSALLAQGSSALDGISVAIVAQLPIGVP